MLNAKQPIKIGNYNVGPQSPPFIIAELSGNHNQDKGLALAMIDAAAQCGAHAIKLQTYTADSMTLNIDHPDFIIKEKDSLWHGERLHQLYQKAATPYAWHASLFEHAANKGLIAFSSPFDAHAVDFLHEMNVPCFKIASFELTDLPLIQYAASKGKPLIMSTGMASLAEIEAAVETASSHGCKEIILLKCTSTYPAKATNTNLATIANMRETFNCQVGLSDHTQGVGVAIGAVALGATVIEKHFVLDRNAGGVDAAFSLEPQELSLLVQESNRAWQAMGRIAYSGTQDEVKSKQYRRSIYVAQNIAAGDTFNTHNLRIVRPAFGLAPSQWFDVLGKTAKHDMQPGTPLSWQDVE